MKLITLFAAVLISLASFGQSANWKEMDDFHAMVSKALHPAEGGNLQPVKENSSSLLDKAKAWQASSAPAAFQYPKLKDDLGNLVASCSKLDDAVKTKKSNKTIKDLAMQTHTAFHTILSATEKNK